MTEIDAEDMEELVAEVREIRDNTVGAKSRVIYWNSSARFVHWLYQNQHLTVIAQRCSICTDISILR